MERQAKYVTFYRKDLGENMERVPVLVAIDGPLKGKSYPLNEGDGNTIGRADECDITIPDTDVSRQHARVILHNSAVWVQDDNSRNGVFVNEKRVVRRPLELQPGGKVTIGIHVFQLELEDKEESQRINLILDEGDADAGSNTIWIALVLVAVVAIGVALYLRT